MGTGETVAVKQVKLADLPKSEIRVITVSIPGPILLKVWLTLSFYSARNRSSQELGCTSAVGIPCQILTNRHYSIPTSSSIGAS